ncbi:MAG: NADH-quinone oxidoreductase subunit M [Candidatus Omnitrophica bacterium]|nr:NADH-quinone oxidoreductase subunit M [Candidatus Omnitrophota bacterium]
MPYLLTTIIFLPLLGALVVALIPGNCDKIIRMTAIAFNAAVLMVVGVLCLLFDRTSGSMQFTETHPWIPQAGIHYTVGVDGISLALVFLTALLGFLACLASNTIKSRIKEYFIVYQILMTGMLGTFLALDLVVFYIFWETVLIPMFFLIGIWGGPRREYAAWKFFFYTLAGSVVMLLAIIGIYFLSTPHTFNMLELAYSSPLLSRTLQAILFLMFFFAFAIKVPVFPFHTWLPDAHVEAPTPVSVILAGVLLKMGTYGLFRVCVPFFPEAVAMFAWSLGVLGAVNLIYGACAAFAQTDFKKLIAYSSVSHMGFVLLGLAAMNSTGFNGSILEMFNHGIITGAMFLLVGVVYERSHTREFSAFGGLASTMPRYAFFLTFMALASLGLPGLSGFVGEFLSLAGIFITFPKLAIISAIGLIAVVVLFLVMVKKVLWGKPKEGVVWSDMSMGEVAVIMPLLILVLIVGFYPDAILDFQKHTVDVLVKTL